VAHKIKDNKNIKQTKLKQGIGQSSLLLPRKKNGNDKRNRIAGHRDMNEVEIRDGDLPYNLCLVNE